MLEKMQVFIRQVKEVSEGLRGVINLLLTGSTCPQVYLFLLHLRRGATKEGSWSYFQEDSI